jgi:hypothetical protein
LTERSGGGADPNARAVMFVLKEGTEWDAWKSGKGNREKRGEHT